MSFSFIAPNQIKVELLQFILEVTKELLPYIEFLWENITITTNITTSVGGMTISTNIEIYDEFTLPVKSKL